MKLSERHRIKNTIMDKKKCFVIMPISECENYSAGHFGRVYEHIIRPACEQAGFTPVRADEIMTTNYIALDIIKHIISSDMAVCDLSNRNPNVLYELGIRQAFNLPVTLIKDTKTNRIFDIQGFRDVEYDESLRIDNVQDAIDEISEVIKNTYENTSEINSLISLLGIEPAKLSEKKQISGETELILNSIMGLEKRISAIDHRMKPVEKLSFYSENQSLPDYVGETIPMTEFTKLTLNDEVFHLRFGKGKIIGIQGLEAGTAKGSVVVFFDNAGKKELLIQFAKLRRVLK
jgi:hypothetical protein